MEWAARGETTIRIISKQHIRSATKRSDQREWTPNGRSDARRFFQFHTVGIFNNFPRLRCLGVSQNVP